MNIVLPYYIALYFPTEYKAAITRIENVFCRIFDGYTTSLNRGGYINSQGNIITEDITIVYSYTDSIDERIKAAIRSLATSSGYSCSQESVAIVFDSTM